MSDINQATTSQRILRWHDVKPLVGISRSQAHLLVSQGRFPAPIKLAKRASGWLESEIQEWIQQRIIKRNNQGAWDE